MIVTRERLRHLATPLQPQLPEPGMGGDQGIHLWLVDLDAGSAAPWQAVAQDLLSQAESERAARFRFERDARRYRISHAVLRTLLAESTGLAPTALPWQEGEHGKPYLAHGGPHFNMSHSGGWALIGICEKCPIGIDIELPHRIDDLDALAGRNFTGSEYQAYADTPEVLRTEVFYRCWTRKEACLKAVGSGLSIEPDVFEAGVEPAIRSTELHAHAKRYGLTVCSVGLPIMAMAAMAWVDSITQQVGSSAPPVVTGHDNVVTRDRPETQPARHHGQGPDPEARPITTRARS